jgi:tRNA (guanine-N7-)-methyltransferase
MHAPSTNTGQRAESLFIEPTDWFMPLVWSDWFGTDRPIEVDLGACDGGFIVERARAQPEVNFLAVERLLGRARKIDKKARRLGLANVRVLRMESTYSLQRLVPAASIQAVYLLFPDPWPKTKHQRRRVIRGGFIASLEQALAPGGRIYAATDHGEYFAEIRQAFAGRKGWKSSIVSEADWLAEQTDFEVEFLKAGKTIGRLKAVWLGAE